MPPEEFNKLSFKQQRDRLDRELDELENKLKKKVKKNQKYLMTIESKKKDNTIASESLEPQIGDNRPNKEFLTRLQYLEKRLERELKESQMKSVKERKEEFKANISQVNQKKERKWIRQRGKAHVLKFTDEEIRKLQECFGALDDDGSGSIGIEELCEPLIGLGFADE